jgi:V/A-type H+/Na+-transporting ATPase subunit I
MFRSERMSEVTLLCKNEHAKETIEALAALKAVHLTDHQKEVVGRAIIDIGKPQANAEELSAALIATRNLLSKLPEDGHQTSEATLRERIERIKEIAASYAEHEERTGAIKQSIADVERKLGILALLPDDLQLEGLNARSVETMLLKKTPESKPIDAMLVKDRGPALLVTVPKGSPKEFIGYEPVDLVPLKGLRGAAIDAAKELTRQHTLLLSDLEQEDAAELGFAQQRGFLKESEPIIALELLKAQAPLHFGTTRHITLIRGFIPAKRAKELKQELESRKIDALVDLGTARDAPVLLSNPKPAKGFESLISLYTLPRYDEIDPTTLMAITFPLFFGFMLGDIGYGICALAAFIALRQRVPQARRLADVFILSAASSIIFGAVFGEFFGAEHIFGLELHPLIHRAESLPLMFTIALIMALVHINLGLAIGAINESHHGWFFAILQKGGWVLVQIGFILLSAKLTILQSLTVFSFTASWAAIMAAFVLAGLALWVWRA